MDNVAERTTDPESVVTALLLTEFETVEEAQVATWTDDQRAQAFDWAMREHLHASDNDAFERLPMPPHVAALQGQKEEPCS